jgi:hypothetical protein
MVLGSTQSLTEMSNRNLPGGKGGLLSRKADNLTAVCWADCLENVEASMSQNRMGLHRLLQGYLYIHYMLYMKLSYKVKIINLFNLIYIIFIMFKEWFNVLENGPPLIYFRSTSRLSSWKRHRELIASTEGFSVEALFAARCISLHFNYLF